MLQFLSYVQYSISGQRIEQLRKFFWCYLPFASHESSQGCPIIVAGGGGGGEPRPRALNSDGPEKNLPLQNDW